MVSVVSRTETPVFDPLVLFFRGGLGRHRVEEPTPG